VRDKPVLDWRPICFPESPSKTFESGENSSEGFRSRIGGMMWVGTPGSTGWPSRRITGSETGWPYLS
jgi:hypothetical protein